MQTQATLLDIVRYYRQYWWPTLYTLAATTAFESLDLVLPYATGQILNVLSQYPLDPVIQNMIEAVAEIFNQPLTQSLSLITLMGLVFLITVVKAPVQPWFSHWRLWDISFRAKRDHYHEAHAKLLTLPLEYFDENNSGRISALVARGISNHTWSYPQIVGQLIPKLLRVITIAGIIFLTEWRIGLAFALSFVGIMYLTSTKLHRLSQLETRIEEYVEDTQSRTSEIILNIKTVKAFATEAYELKRQQERLEREFKVVDYRLHYGYVQLNVLRTTLVQSCVFIILCFSLIAAVKGSISIGYFVMITTLSNMAYSEVAPIGTFAEFFARRFGSMARLDAFFKNPSGSDAQSMDLSPQSWRKPPSAFPAFKGQIEFRHVSFGYTPQHSVLKDFHILIQPRQTVALVGRSGSGKSTLVKLLFRYFDPTQGQILVDGKDIRDLGVTDYRQRLALVHQEVDVFNGTLLENLTYGNPEASFEEVQNACHIARVDEFLPMLPKGYYTLVGERGIRLSGGQRQRLGIARALIRDPDILVFDEATSSLDYESEKAIQLAMQDILGTRTTLIIAHRLSTVRDADLIIVLDQGCIVEVGNHQELLKQGGLYNRFHQLQESGELVRSVGSNPLF